MLPAHCSNSRLPEPVPRPDGRRRLLRFFVAVTGLILVWFGLLPRLGDLPVVRNRIERNEALNINPGAMYYSELEAMPRIIDAVDHTRESSNEAFWEPSFRGSESSK